MKMIDPADLQAFLTKIEGGAVAVDLYKIGSKHHQEHAATGNKNSKHNGNFRVALDIEDCLDRFYGGYYSDWACGGQWNRAYQFVQLLSHAFNNSHVEVIAFFDGTLKKNKKITAERNDFRQKTISVLKHIRMIGTPPPKIWWLPPSGIRTVLRNALRSVNIQVVQTVNDHTMEVIDYFREQKLDGILGLHPDYIIANASRYFSSHDLRLSYKGALETKEYMVSKLLSSLSLTADHLPFVAVFLGGYIQIDDAKLKAMHERLKIDGNLDFEARIRKIAEIVRNSPTTDIDEFIKHLNLIEFEKEIKESVEYYQRRGKFSTKKQQGGKKRNELLKPVAVTDPPLPFASETNDNDEAAKKILKDASSLVDDGENGTVASSPASSGDSNGKEKPDKSEKPEKPEKSEKETKVTKTQQPFVYTLPGEVLKTSLNRHQRGMMDPRIYQLLIKKEIILPQVLEDEQYREIPSVHMFYRPARQMIYAILFNLYHQKYLCSKRNSNGGGNGDKKEKNQKGNTGQKPPDVQVAEWVWSPQNEYKKPDLVTATPLPWAVPTIQRLWFGMVFDDKQRRMRAFLTIMRSDAPLMLNRSYVPQHMLVMACVLRYIVTSPDRNILTRQELDAFLATAFSPQLTMVENTQELVLPGVHLRGVYLATLFMQGVETASLANDACGVPLPWTMVNPWLFFDGKLFHLKLKMSTYVSSLRELCDDHIEIVMKIERFRKAILEDVEHLMLPAAHIDPMYRPGFLPPPALPLQAFGKNSAAAAAALHPLASAANSNGAFFYNPQSPYFTLSPAVLGGREQVTGVNPRVNGRNGRNQGGNQRGNGQNRKGYQLKVGGIVTGSWAAGGGAAAAAAVAAASRSLCGPPNNRLGNRLTGNLAARIGLNNRGGRNSINQRLQRNQNSSSATGGRGGVSMARGGPLAANTKLNSRNRNRNKRKENRKNANKNQKKEDDDVKDEKLATNESDPSTTTAEKESIDSVSEQIQGISLNDCTVELQNGTTVLGSDLANQICNSILNDDDCTIKTKVTSSSSDNHKDDKDKISTSTVSSSSTTVTTIHGTDLKNVTNPSLETQSSSIDSTTKDAYQLLDSPVASDAMQKNPKKPAKVGDSIAIEAEVQVKG